MQGDIYALARYYEQRVAAGEEIEVVIGVDDAVAYREEPINRLLPLGTELWERGGRRFEKRVRDFDPHFFFIDSHLPRKRIFRNLIHLWHGFGWKEHRAEVEFAGQHRKIRRLVGSVTEPNGAFIHQCYGEFELEHRVRYSRFARENCQVMGMLYADLLIDPPVTREQIREFYPFENPDRKTVLLGFTWGFGRVFDHWDVDESEIMDRLFTRLAEREVNVIFRLHDRWRYDARYLRMLERCAARFGNIFLKYKDAERDNLFDCLLADVIVSNFSGLVVYACYTGSASLHLHPFGTNPDHRPLYRALLGRAWRDKRADYAWKMPPEENGGLLAATEEELFERLDEAIDDPTCCQERAKSFVAKYMESTDGDCCARLDTYLRAWHEGGVKPH